MKTKFKNKPENHVKSILLAYLILALHIILIAGLGLLVIFFAGIINYMLWIFLGCLSLIIFSGYYIYKRMRKEGITSVKTSYSHGFGLYSLSERCNNMGGELKIESTSGKGSKATLYIPD